MTTFQTIPLDQLPKREPRGFDKAKAEALLAAVQSAPNVGAGDGKSYADDKAARTEAQKHKRLLAHVAPPGKLARSQTFAHPSGKGFAWIVKLDDKPADKGK